MSKTLLILIGIACAVIMAFVGCSAIQIAPEQQVFNNIHQWLSINHFTYSLANSKTSEVIIFEGPLGIVKTCLFEKSLGSGGKLKDWDTVIFQEYTTIKPSYVKLPFSMISDLDGILKVFSGVDQKDWRVRGNLSDSNIIIAPDKETPWITIGKVLENCGKNIIWKTSFLVSKDDSKIGVIPVYLPHERRGGVIMSSVDWSITIRIRKGYKSGTPEWDIFRKNINDGLVQYKEKDAKFDAYAKLQVDDNTVFKDIIEVIDIVRQSGIKDNIMFSTQTRPPKSQKPDVEIERYFVFEAIIKEEDMELDEEDEPVK